MSDRLMVDNHRTEEKNTHKRDDVRVDRLKIFLS